METGTALGTVATTPSPVQGSSQGQQTSGSEGNSADQGGQAQHQQQGSSHSPGQKPKGQPGDTKAQAPQAPAKPELFEVKVDGKVIKMTRDELIQHASLGHAAQKRFQEAAQLRKQAEAVIGKLRDPNKVIDALMDPALGLTKEQIRERFEEWYAKEFIEPEQLTPEQKKLREYERKLQDYAEKEKQIEEQKQREQQESMTAQAREQVQGQIIEALESGKLPKTNFTIRRLAYWMQRNHANGFNAPTEVLISQVKNEIGSSLRELVEASDGDVLIQLLGDSVIQKLRKYDLEQLRKLRNQGQGTQSPEPRDTGAPRTPTERPPTSAEVNERIRNLQRTGRF